MQEPFYFTSGNHRVFGVFYPPEGEARTEGFVICNGFGKEYNLCLSPLVGFARILASRGYPVLRFDYAGYADSTGAFEDATISTMRDDITAAADELVRRARIERLGLLGMRFGAALAVMVAAERDDVAHLVLWEPVLNPWSYIFGELRQTVTMQTVLFREVRITRDRIVENILGKRPSIHGGYDFNIIDEGFPLGAKLLREAREANIIDPPPRLEARVLMLNIRKKEGPAPRAMADFAARLHQMGVDCRLEGAVEPCTFWKYDNIYATRGPQMYARTLAWLEEA